MKVEILFKDGTKAIFQNITTADESESFFCYILDSGQTLFIRKENLSYLLLTP